MKEIEELNGVILSIDTQLDRMKKTPNFQIKANETFAFLEKNPIPAHLLKEIKDDRIKRRFEQNMSIEQIAQVLELPKAEVLAALEEMGLIERVIG